MAPPTFDPAVLERLAAQAKTHGDGQLVRELIEDAIGSIEHCTKELAAATDARDHDRARSHAHRVKSVLRQVGAVRMGDAAARAEVLAAAGDDAAFAAARDVLAERVDTIAALRRHLASLQEAP